MRKLWNSKILGHIDYVLFALVVLLTIIGLVVLASASSELGKIRFNDSYYYLKQQIVHGLSLGIFGFLVGLFVPYRFYRRVAMFGLIFNIILLCLVFTPLGITIGGASRWVKLGQFAFQPAELLKITFIIYAAAWLSGSKFNRVGEFWRGFVPFGAVTGLVGTLLLLQPATSTVLILIAAAGTMYFVSGMPWRFLAIGLLAILILFGSLIYLTPYRLQRVLTFFNPDADQQGASYQINQALISIGSGSVWGMGYGQSTSKASTLPAPLDDSIFAIAAQELGFIGASFLVLLFAMLVFRLFSLARKMKDRFAQLVLVGFGSIIALQSIVNMGAISGILPLTGIPLPFVSFGGTALGVFLTMSGIAINISKSQSR